MGTDRPSPTSSTDVLLGQIHDELVGLRQDLADDRGGAVDPPADGRVEIREPAEAPPDTSWTKTSHVRDR